jgi:predicted nucleotidyltransferase
MHLSTDQIENIKKFLISKVDPYLIIIFGSAAQGRMNPDSDIDVAYLSHHRAVSAYDLYMLAQEMAGIVGRDIHLIDLQQASTVLQAQVVSRGTVILDLEPQKRQEFFILTLKQYARLNEERKPILAKAKERGRIYA